MLWRHSNWFSTLWLSLGLALTGCGGGGGGGGSGGKGGPGPVDPKPLAQLVSIEVTPADSSLPTGVSQHFKATGVYSDSTSEDITAEVSWSSADADIAAVDASGLVTGEAAGGPIDISAALDGITGKTAVTVTHARLEAIDITPPTASVPAGMKQKFTATGTYSDGSTLDISNQVTWSSSYAAVATIDATGLVTSKAKSAGITITARLGTKSDIANLIVTDATLESISITTPDSSIAAGYKSQYTATGLYSDGRKVNVTGSATWSSSNGTVATVGNGPKAGEVSALKKGAATIQASFGGKSDSDAFTVTDAELVSIAVSASSPTLAAGFKQTYGAQGTYSDGSSQNLSNQVVWSVSGDTVARVSNEAGSKGEVTALAVGGPINVIATSGPVTGSSVLSVTAAVLMSIEVSADATQVPAGMDQQFVATGVYSDDSRIDVTDQATWSSSDTVVAKVSNADGSSGLVTTLSVGDTSIGATIDGVSGSLGLGVTAAVLESLSVESANDSLVLGAKQQYKAIGHYSDGMSLDLTGVSTWSSSDAAIATISNADGSHGLATAVGTGGPVTIEATHEGVSDSRSLTVTDAILVSITVTSDSELLFEGLKQQYTATGTYSDNSEADLTALVSWSVSDPAMASISNEDGSNGLLTAVEVGGPVDVIATLDGLSGSTPLSVEEATLSLLTVLPTSHDLPLGLTVQFSVIGTYSDESELDLTDDVLWSSSDPATATISNAPGSQGLASAVALGGPVTITATLGAVSVTADLTVTDATLTSLAVTPADLDLPRGVSQQYVATATFSDGSLQDVTQQVVWASSAPAVASIGNLDGSKGIAKTLTVGSTTISATLAGFDDTPATADLTVNNLLVSSVEVRPDAAICGRTRTFQFGAFVVYNDGTEQNLTAQARWTSSVTRYASIGLSTGLAKLTGSPQPWRLGDTTITARVLGTTDTAVLTKVKDKDMACTTTP